MIPLDTIKKGIETGDMDVVAEGYRQLTGVRLTPAKASPGLIPDAVLEAAKIVSEYIQLQNAVEEVITKPAPAKKVKKAATKKAKAKAKKPELDLPETTFDDDELESIEFSKQMADRKRPKRPPFRLVKVKCDGCSKVVETHPDFKPLKLERGEEPSKFYCPSCGGGNTR